VHICVLGEFRGVYAELRREFKWGNLDLVFFEGLTVVPRGSIEEGGRLVFPPVLLGEFMCVGVLGLDGIGREAMGRGVGGHFGGILGGTGEGFVDSINTLRGNLWAKCSYMGS
jgi:hypothetical protein